MNTGDPALRGATKDALVPSNILQDSLFSSDPGNSNNVPVNDDDDDVEVSDESGLVGDESVHEIEDEEDDDENEKEDEDEDEDEEDHVTIEEDEYDDQEEGEDFDSAYEPSESQYDENEEDDVAAEEDGDGGQEESEDFNSAYEPSESQYDENEEDDVAAEEDGGGGQEEGEDFDSAYEPSESQYGENEELDITADEENYGAFEPDAEDIEIGEGEDGEVMDQAEKLKVDSNGPTLSPNQSKDGLYKLTLKLQNKEEIPKFDLEHIRSIFPSFVKVPSIPSRPGVPINVLFESKELAHEAFKRHVIEKSRSPESVRITICGQELTVLPPKQVDIIRSGEQRPKQQIRQKSSSRTSSMINQQTYVPQKIPQSISADTEQEGIMPKSKRTPRSKSKQKPSKPQTEEITQPQPSTTQGGTTAMSEKLAKPIRKQKTFKLQPSGDNISLKSPPGSIENAQTEQRTQPQSQLQPSTIQGGTTARAKRPPWSNTKQKPLKLQPSNGNMPLESPLSSIENAQTEEETQPLSQPSTPSTAQEGSKPKSEKPARSNTKQKPLKLQPSSGNMPLEPPLSSIENAQTEQRTQPQSQLQPSTTQGGTTARSKRPPWSNTKQKPLKLQPSSGDMSLESPLSSIENAQAEEGSQSLSKPSTTDTAQGELTTKSNRPPWSNTKKKPLKLQPSNGNMPLEPPLSSIENAQAEERNQPQLQPSTTDTGQGELTTKSKKPARSNTKQNPLKLQPSNGNMPLEPPLSSIENAQTEEETQPLSQPSTTDTGQGELTTKSKRPPWSNTKKKPLKLQPSSGNMSLESPLSSIENAQAEEGSQPQSQPSTTDTGQGELTTKSKKPARSNTKQNPLKLQPSNGNMPLEPPLSSIENAQTEEETQPLSQSSTPSIAQGELTNKSKKPARSNTKQKSFKFQPSSGNMPLEPPLSSIENAQAEEGSQPQSQPSTTDTAQGELTTKSKKPARSNTKQKSFKFQPSSGNMSLESPLSSIENAQTEEETQPLSQSSTPSIAQEELKTKSKKPYRTNSISLDRHQSSNTIVATSITSPYRQDNFVQNETQAGSIARNADQDRISKKSNSSSGASNFPVKHPSSIGTLPAPSVSTSISDMGMQDYRKSELASGKPNDRSGKSPPIPRNSRSDPQRKDTSPTARMETMICLIEKDDDMEWVVAVKLVEDYIKSKINFRFSISNESCSLSAFSFECSTNRILHLARMFGAPSSIRIGPISAMLTTKALQLSMKPSDFLFTLPLEREFLTKTQHLLDQVKKEYGISITIGYPIMLVFKGSFYQMKNFVDGPYYKDLAAKTRSITRHVNKIITKELISRFCVDYDDRKLIGFTNQDLDNAEKFLMERWKRNPSNTQNVHPMHGQGSLCDASCKLSPYQTRWIEFNWKYLTSNSMVHIDMKRNPGAVFLKGKKDFVDSFMKTIRELESKKIDVNFQHPEENVELDASSSKLDSTPIGEAPKAIDHEPKRKYIESVLLTAKKGVPITFEVILKSENPLAFSVDIVCPKESINNVIIYLEKRTVVYKALPPILCKGGQFFFPVTFKKYGHEFRFDRVKNILHIYANGSLRTRFGPLSETDPQAYHLQCKFLMEKGVKFIQSLCETTATGYCFRRLPVGEKGLEFYVPTEKERSWVSIENIIFSRVVHQKMTLNGEWSYHHLSILHKHLKSTSCAYRIPPLDATDIINSFVVDYCCFEEDRQDIENFLKSAAPGNASLEVDMQHLGLFKSTEQDGFTLLPMDERAIVVISRDQECSPEAGTVVLMIYSIHKDAEKDVIILINSNLHGTKGGGLEGDSIEERYLILDGTSLCRILYYHQITREACLSYSNENTKVEFVRESTFPELMGIKLRGKKKYLNQTLELLKKFIESVKHSISTHTQELQPHEAGCWGTLSWLSERSKLNDVDIDITSVDGKTKKSSPSQGSKFLRVVKFPNNVTFQIRHGNIINDSDVSALVLACDNMFQQGGGIARKIHHTFGAKYQDMCRKYIENGGQVRTLNCVSFKVMENPTRFVVNSVAPVFKKNLSDTEVVASLEKMFCNIFHEARRIGIESLALPALGSRVFGNPIKLVMNALIRALKSEIITKEESDIKIIRFVDMNIAAIHELTSIVDKTFESYPVEKWYSKANDLFFPSQPIYSWSWRNDDDEFIPYDHDTNWIVDQAFKSNSPTVSVYIPMSDSTHSRRYIINFGTMRQYNRVSNHYRDIAKELLSSANSPSQSDMLVASGSESEYNSDSDSDSDVSGDELNDDEEGLGLSETRRLWQNTRSFYLKVTHIREHLDGAVRMSLDMLRRCITFVDAVLPIGNQDPDFEHLIRSIEIGHQVSVSVVSEQKSKNAKVQIEGVKERIMQAKMELIEGAYKIYDTNYYAKTAFPISWIEPSPKGKLADVTRDSYEWVEIQQKIEESLFNIQIDGIQRIQNDLMWEQHTKKKESISKIMGHNPAVTRLFHGTKSRNPVLIYNDPDHVGFKTRFCSHGAWGQGLYFASKAKYSDIFKFDDGQGRFQIILAEVITGESVTMAPNSLLKEPPMNPMNNQRYTSVKGFLQDSPIYIVYDDYMAYPSYLITYHYNAATN